jgi:hypothetical protein
MATLNLAGGPRGHGLVVCPPPLPRGVPPRPHTRHGAGGADASVLLTHEYCLRENIAYARVRARVSVCVSIQSQRAHFAQKKSGKCFELFSTQKKRVYTFPLFFVPMQFSALLSMGSSGRFLCDS